MICPNCKKDKKVVKKRIIFLKAINQSAQSQLPMCTTCFNKLQKALQSQV